MSVRKIAPTAWSGKTRAGELDAGRQAVGLCLSRERLWRLSGSQATGADQSHWPRRGNGQALGLLTCSDDAPERWRVCLSDANSPYRSPVGGHCCLEGLFGAPGAAPWARDLPQRAEWVRVCTRTHVFSLSPTPPPPSSASDPSKATHTPTKKSNSVLSYVLLKSMW